MHGIFSALVFIIIRLLHYEGAKAGAEIKHGVKFHVIRLIKSRRDIA